MGKNVSLYSSGWPGTCYVDQAASDSTEILVSLPGIKGMCHHAWLWCSFIYNYFQLFLGACLHSMKLNQPVNSA